MNAWIPGLACLSAGALFSLLLFRFAIPRIVKYRLLARRVGKVFAAYSHKDVREVELIGQVIKGLGGELIRDHTHIRGGENWKEKLTQLIDTADTFQLFWSKNAFASN